jgi:hypothetical protein
MAVLSRRDAEWFAPPGDGGREYLVAPLTFRERQAFRAALTAEAGMFPTSPQMLDALKAAVREIAPDNAGEWIDTIDAATADEADEAARARLVSVEAVCAGVPAYAALLAARQRYLGMMPFIAAQYALRGWRGADVPEFRRERGIVPGDLLDLIPADEIEAIGWRASAMMQPDKAAEKN